MKRYEQACAIARALDVVGERWSLLLVRELTFGPRRYRDLATGLPGIPSNVLAARLKDLQAASVVTRRTLPAPTDVTVYELTDAGRALQPALKELLDWGLRYAPAPSPGDAVQPGWGLLGAAGGPAADGPPPGLALVVLAAAQLMVVLDATIVNVALPHIQRALGFSGTNLEWVVNAYALAFGGLLLLGGRAGDLLGRRKMFIAGLLLFSAASLAGGFADSQAFLLTARAVQGVGGALVAPAALSLITTTFPEGPPRPRALGVYAAMSIDGGAIGLIGGGLLAPYAPWRGVLFLHLPPRAPGPL